MAVGLVVILLAVLFGPVLIKPIERNIEIFFLVAGFAAVALTGRLTWPTIRAAAIEPIDLTVAVLVFGGIVRVMRTTLDGWIVRIRAVMPTHWIQFTLIVALGFISSVITAVVASLLLVEAVVLLDFERRSEIATVVLACFAIGLGAALTPIGLPLSTIALAALHVDFWYMARLLWPLVVAGVAIVGVVGLMLPIRHGNPLKAVRDDQSWSGVIIRAVKIYLFVAGLVGLSQGLRPMVDVYITKMPIVILFWLNSISAVVDNATLAAAEIGPSLTVAQQRAVLMGLLISGGMLIPGNIPNIVAAGRLGIGSREWARVGLPVGLPLMAVCFVVLWLWS